MDTGMNTLDTDEIKQIVKASQERREGEPTRAIRILLRVEGMGSFKADGADTALGHASIWITAGQSVKLIATPAPANRFSYWDYNGNYMSNSPTHTCNPWGAGSTITAHFTQ